MSGFFHLDIMDDIKEGYDDGKTISNWTGFFLSQIQDMRIAKRVSPFR
jgi:hypothetical protein